MFTNYLSTSLWGMVMLIYVFYILLLGKFSSVQFSCSVVSDFLQPHEPQHARPLCPSPTPRVHQTHVPLCITPTDQIRSVAQSCPTLWDPMNRSTPGLPVHHQLPEFTRTHVHRVGDAIQPSHPLSSPSPPAPNPSQHQSLFPMSQLFT